MLTDDEIIEIGNEVHRAMPDDADEQMELLAIAREIEDRLLNTPELHDFARGVILEALHQRDRWGTEHDEGKDPIDWHWLIAHLAGKALFHQQEYERLMQSVTPKQLETLPAIHMVIDRHREKATHHMVTTAAAMANWHANFNGMDIDVMVNTPQEVQHDDA